MSEKLTLIDIPDRAPDVVLPRNLEVVKVEIWVEENLFRCEGYVKAYNQVSSKDATFKCSIKYLEWTAQHWLGTARSEVALTYLAETVLLRSDNLNRIEYNVDKN